MHPQLAQKLVKSGLPLVDIGAAAGNAMSLNVLERLIPRSARSFIMFRLLALK